MALYFNGFMIGNTTFVSAKAYMNGQNLSDIYFNGVKVWYELALPGSQTFTSNGTFTVPVGITSLTLCMCGGGGAGGTNHYDDMGGGYAGQVVSQTIVVTPGETISVTVGSGGASQTVDNVTAPYNGNPGSASYFFADSGTISAAGGAGGNDTPAYQGNGASRTTCGGTYTDGLGDSYDLNFAYGGQAGAFGNGGQGIADPYSVIGGNGGVGAGGGAAVTSTFTYSRTSGAGGRGQVVVSWG